MPGRNRMPLLIPICTLFLGMGTLAGAAPRPETLVEVEDLVREFVQKDWIVGAEFLVLHEGEVLSHVSAGWRDREQERPMALHSIFSIRSMAKPLVGAIAHRLIDRGVLRSDQRVADHLPAFAEGRAAEITIEHLLTHRSGLRDGNPTGRPADYPTLRSIADFWGTEGPTLCSPGEDFHYSDPGSDVLAAVLEVVSGLDLAELARQELFEPLGMRDSRAFSGAERSADPRYVSRYRPDGAGGWRRVWKPGDGPRIPFAIGSGTTWTTTPADYARFLRAWILEGEVEGARWLSREAVTGALTPLSTMEGYLSAIAEVEVSYGEMWQIYTPTADTTAPPCIFGHSGSGGTYAWAWPGEDLVVLYFTQSMGQRTRLTLEQHFKALLENLPEPPRTGG